MCTQEDLGLLSLRNHKSYLHTLHATAPHVVGFHCLTCSNAGELRGASHSRQSVAARRARERRLQAASPVDWHHECRFCEQVEQEAEWQTPSGEQRVGLMLPRTSTSHAPPSREGTCFSRGACAAPAARCPSPPRGLMSGSALLFEPAPPPHRPVRATGR